MSLRCGTAAEPPRGSFTAADYAAYARLPYTTAVWRLSRLVEVGKLKSALFRSKNGSRQRFYWLACLLLCALSGHAQTQIDINRQTRGVLQLNRGGTGQTNWIGGRCVQVAWDGSKLEGASAPCALVGHEHLLSGDVTGLTTSSMVVRIQGRGVSNAAPSDGQALVWNQASSRWEPRNVTIDASQIVSGTLADARVAQSNVTQHQGALQLSASQITSGVLPLARGGTGQSAWTAGSCVQVSADGTRLESASGPCVTGGGVGGSGNAGSIAMWTDSTTLGNSAITQGQDAVTIAKNLVVTGGIESQSSESGAVVLYSASGGSVTLQAPDASSSFTLTVPAANATLAVEGHEHDASAISSGVLPVARGGTGVGSFAGGRCIQSSADGQSLTVASGACAVDGHSHTLAGDVTGSIGSTTVARIQGRNVSSAAPSDGQALVWSASESQWKPATVGGGSGSWGPMDDTVLWFREDFPTTSTSSNQIGTHGWASSCASGTISVVSKTGSSPFKKAYRMETGATSGNICYIALGSTSTTATALGALGSYGSWDSIFYFRNNSAASTGMVLFVGYIVGGSNTPSGGSATARIGVEYDASRGDTNFMFVACNGSNCTRQSSGVSFNTAWHKVRIRSQTAGTILFSLDGGTEVSINTNVPTNALAPIFGVRAEEAAAKRVEADRWYWSGPNAQ